MANLVISFFIIPFCVAPSAVVWLTCPKRIVSAFNKQTRVSETICAARFWTAFLAAAFFVPHHSTACTNKIFLTFSIRAVFLSYSLADLMISFFIEPLAIASTTVVCFTCPVRVISAHIRVARINKAFNAFFLAAEFTAAVLVPCATASSFAFFWRF